MSLVVGVVSVVVGVFSIVFCVGVSIVVSRSIGFSSWCS